MVFNKILITDKNELMSHKEKIFQLFASTYDCPIDEDLWNWAYIENPNGSPIVSLYYDNEKLIGHYAVIPIKLENKNNKNIRAVLSMTTMVEASYRKFGIFIAQANEVYEKAQNIGYRLVFGFPNKKSAPGFRKRLNWTLEEDLYVAKLNKNELVSIKSSINKNSLKFNTSDEKSLQWRLNKPNQEYIKRDKNILKKFGNEFDIVYSCGNFKTLDASLEYNILITQEFNKFIKQKKFKYIFGYRLFDNSLKGLSLKKDLIMSDVF